MHGYWHNRGLAAALLIRNDDGQQLVAKVWPVLACRREGGAQMFGPLTNSYAWKQKTVSRGQKQESAVSDDYPEATSEARSLPGHGLPEFHPLRTENQGDSGDPTSPKSQPGKTSCFIPIVYVSHLSH